LLNLARKVTLVLTSHLFAALLPFSVEQILVSGRSYDFLGEDTPDSERQSYQTGKIFRGNCSEKEFKRAAPPSLSVTLNFLDGQVAFSHPRQFKRTAQMRGLLQI
jgi:hypothetical protein